MINFFKKVIGIKIYTPDEIEQSTVLADIIIQDLTKLFNELDDVNLCLALKTHCLCRGIPVRMCHPKGYTITNDVIYKESYLDESPDTLIPKDQKRIYTVVKNFYTARQIEERRKQAKLTIDNILNDFEKSAS